MRCCAAITTLPLLALALLAGPAQAAYYYVLPAFTVSACTDNGAGKVSLTVTGHNLTTALPVTLTGVTGCNAAINGTHTVLATGTDWIDIDLGYTSGLTVAGVASHGLNTSPYDTCSDKAVDGCYCR
jgi:hypothetical protein